MTLRGSPSGVSFQFGTWSPAEREAASADVLGARQQIGEAALRAMYPSIELRAGEVATASWPAGGLALGIPTPAPPERTDGSNAIDRLVRAMAGSSWEVLVLAEPVGEDFTSELRRRTINEMRTGSRGGTSDARPQSAEPALQQAARSGSRLAYRRAVIGKRWRYGCLSAGYGDELPVPRRGVARVFSGPRSLPEPLRVYDGTLAASLATDWAMPDIVGPDGPGCCTGTRMPARRSSRPPSSRVT